MKISVLTPSYNSGAYIDRAIRSVIGQDYKNFEHIIVDGGSTDRTLTVLKGYKHLRWVSETDAGQSDAMNKAFKMSTGDIIVYLNADDEFSAGAFTKIVAAFNDDQKADMVLGNLIFNSAKGKSFKIPSPKYIDVVLYWRDRYPYNPVSYFYKRNVQNKVGNFPLNDHFAMDIWFLLKAYQKFRVIKINSVLGTFHFDGNNKTANTDVGANLHNAVKKHLMKNNLLLLPYFYFKLYQGKVIANN